MAAHKNEKRIQDMFSTHIELVSETLQSMIKTIRLYNEGNYEVSREQAHKSHVKEGEADGMRRKLIEAMYTAAFLPMVREDLVEYLAKQDKIADHAEAVCDFLITQRPKIPGEFTDALVKISENGPRALGHLKKAMEGFFTNFSKIRNHIKEVNTIEEDVDTQEWHLSEKIYSSNSLKLDEKIHLNSLVYLLSLIADTIENAADMLDSMVVTKKI